MGESGASKESDPLSYGSQAGQRIVAGLFALNALWGVQAWSQRSMYFFGHRSDRPMSLEVRALAVLPASPAGPAEIAVLPSSAPFLLFYHIDSAGAIVPVDTCGIPSGQETLLTADLEGDGRHEYITMNGAAGDLHIIRRSAEGFAETSYQVPQTQHVGVGDINSDGRPDLLFFGRTTAGVATLLNRRPGIFVRGPVLFPDISVCDLRVTDLDGDGVNDVFLLDWLSNKLDVFTGISRMVFSEQLQVTLPGEPGALALGPVTPQRRVRLAITIPSARRILVYDGNALGDFINSAVIECPSPPEGVAMEDIDGDHLPDIVSTTDHGVIVRAGVPAPAAERTQFFAPSATSATWAVADVDGDGLPDLVAMDRRTRRLCVVFNDGRASAPQHDNVYAVGMDPRGIALADMDHDGNNDILVANEGSSTVSLLKNEGDGRFRAQQSLLVGESPSAVAPVDGRTPGFVVSDAMAGHVRVVTMEGDRSASSTIAMPAGRKPEVLEASLNPALRRIEIMLRSHDDAGNGVLLTFLEQLSRRQFLERAFRPSVASTVLAATARRDVLTGGLDALFATNDPRTGRTTVYSTTATSEFAFGALRPVFSYSDSMSSTFLLAWGQTTGESVSAAAVALREPSDMVAVFSISGDTLAGSVQWIRGFRPMDDTAMALEDVDGDGITDLVFDDALRKEIFFFRGDENFGFTAPVPVTAAENAGNFVVGHLRHSAASDLVITDARAGTVRVLLDPFRRFGE